MLHQRVVFSERTPSQRVVFKERVALSECGFQREGILSEGSFQTEHTSSQRVVLRGRVPFIPQSLIMNLTTVSALKVQYPNSGYHTMLLQQGVRVKQVQLRESMHHVDPNRIINQMERVHSKEAIQCAISPSFVASRRKSQADKVST